MSAANEHGPLTNSALCTGDPLAKALAVLEPMPTTVNRDQLMFAAGAAGRDRAVAFWKRIVVAQSTAACLLVGVGLATYDFAPNGTRSADGASQQYAEKTAPTPAPKPPAKAVPPAPAPVPSTSEDVEDTTKVAKYLLFRANVLALGLNALPNPNAAPSNVDVGSLEDSLQLPRGTFAIHGIPTKKKTTSDDE